MADLRALFDDLVRFETMLWSAIDERLQADCGLTLSNLNVMLVIDGTGDCRVLDIADALAITVGGTSQAVDRLEKAGWSRRRAHPTDRRSSIVELTPEGLATLRSAEPVFEDELERLIADPLAEAGVVSMADSLGILRRSIVRVRPPN